MLRFFGSPDDVLGYAKTYTRIVSLGFGRVVLSVPGSNIEGGGTADSEQQGKRYAGKAQGKGDVGRRVAQFADRPADENAIMISSFHCCFQCSTIRT